MQEFLALFFVLFSTSSLLLVHDLTLGRKQKNKYMFARKIISLLVASGSLIGGIYMYTLKSAPMRRGGGLSEKNEEPFVKEEIKKKSNRERLNTRDKEKKDPVENQLPEKEWVEKEQLKLSGVDGSLSVGSPHQKPREASVLHDEEKMAPCPNPWMHSKKRRVMFSVSLLCIVGGVMYVSYLVGREDEAKTWTGKLREKEKKTLTEEQKAGEYQTKVVYSLISLNGAFLNNKRVNNRYRDTEEDKKLKKWVKEEQFIEKARTAMSDKSFSLEKVVIEKNVSAKKNVIDWICKMMDPSFKFRSTRIKPTKKLQDLLKKEKANQAKRAQKLEVLLLKRVVSKESESIENFIRAAIAQMLAFFLEDKGSVLDSKKDLTSFFYCLFLDRRWEQLMQAMKDSINQKDEKDLMEIFVDQWGGFCKKVPVRKIDEELFG